MKIEIKWSIIISVLNFVWLCAEYVTGLHSRYVDVLPYVTIFSIIIPIAGLNKAIREKRDRQYNGQISFWQSMQCGSIITVISAVLSIFSIIVYFKIVNPDYVAFMISHTAQKAAENGENISQATQNAAQFFNMKSYMQQSFAGTMFIGLTLTLLISIFIKKKSRLWQD